MATLGTTTYDALIAGPQSRLVTDSVLIQKGHIFKRGTLLGKFIESNIFSICDSTDTTLGLKNLCAILAEDIDTMDAIKPAMVYFAGDFNVAALIAKTGETPEQYRWQARALGIFYRTIIENK